MHDEPITADTLLADCFQPVRYSAKWRAIYRDGRVGPWHIWAFSGAISSMAERDFIIADIKHRGWRIGRIIGDGILTDWDNDGVRRLEYRLTRAE